MNGGFQSVQSVLFICLFHLGRGILIGATLVDDLRLRPRTIHISMSARTKDLGFISVWAGGRDVDTLSGTYMPWVEDMAAGFGWRSQGNGWLARRWRPSVECFSALSISLGAFFF